MSKYTKKGPEHDFHPATFPNYHFTIKVTSLTENNFLRSTRITATSGSPIATDDAALRAYV
jgi:hypothetical protein